jgi:hypothetical protein
MFIGILIWSNSDDLTVFNNTPLILKINSVRGQQADVDVALENRVQSKPGVNLITAGRPSSHFARSDVVIILGCTGDPEPDFSKKLIHLIREKMLDDSHVLENWVRLPLALLTQPPAPRASL